MTQTHKNIDVTALYGLFIVSIIMNFIPSLAIQSWGGLLFLICFIATYIAKFMADKESFKYGHYSYITKSVWIFSLLFCFGVILAYIFGNHETIYSLTTNIQNGVIPSNDMLISALIKYGFENIMLFLAIFLPITLHILYRFGKGLYFAQKNKTPSLKSWI